DEGERVGQEAGPIHCQGVEGLATTPSSLARTTQGTVRTSNPALVVVRPPEYIAPYVLNRENPNHRTSEVTMNTGFPTGLLATITRVVVNQDDSGQKLNAIAAEPPAIFPGEKPSGHGFARFDFLMDDAAPTVKPIKASRHEGTGVNPQVEGQLRCVVV